MNLSNQAEYEVLRQTIHERGTARLFAVLVGVTVWAALATALPAAGLHGIVVLVLLIVLAATFEVNFFIHTGVERIGRYVQVFYEERSNTAGWETTAMSYGLKFPSGLDPLFSTIFAAAALVNFFIPLVVERRPGWIALSLLAHLAFGYRIATARKLAASQRALDLDRFRNLANEKSTDHQPSNLQ